MGILLTILTTLSNQKSKIFETSYGSSERVAFDCKKYVQRYTFRYSEKFRFPRFDRKRVRSKRVPTSGALRAWNATHSGSEEWVKIFDFKEVVASKTSS
mgnify:CR=1 FL=1